MGPGCFYPGNISTPAAQIAQHLLQWGRDVSIPEMLLLGALPFRRCCFNGAGMFLSRKSGQYYYLDLIPAASMGPGCFYPGNETPQGTPASGCPASMGPGCFYPGNGRRGRVLPARDGASMGPGCFYPGNKNAQRDYSHFYRPLQWGRDVSIPEIPLAVAWARGLQQASMGPGCFYPGNGPNFRSGHIRKAVLQWGRDVSIPEMWLKGAARLHPTALQWGRDVSIPEIDLYSQRRRTWRSFNGAGMFLSRKYSAGQRAAHLQVHASMGPGCFYPGNTAFRQSGGAVLPQSFNGAGMFLSRKLIVLA